MTLPDTADGTILTSTNPRSGNIIQVVQGSVVDTEKAFTTTSFVASDLSATITPVFASSKILIHTTQVLDTAANGRQLYLGIFRSIAGGTYTNISGGTQNSNVGAYSSSSRLIETAVIIKLDTPSYSVGQAITYKIYGKNSGSYETRVGGQQTEQLMVLQEVAA
tara:strand:- start:1371 stop:1862 length:492 start_codon:yes stop_codon:yes gene_type:complete